MSREQLLADALRLEDKEPDAHKDLWLLSLSVAEGEICLIVEAVTSAGAVAVADTWDLMPAPEAIRELRISGPHRRDYWPPQYWYRWLTETEVLEMEASLAAPSAE
jgi:hypothetical protein